MGISETAAPVGFPVRKRRVLPKASERGRGQAFVVVSSTWHGQRNIGYIPKAQRVCTLIEMVKCDEMGKSPTFEFECKYVVLVLTPVAPNEQLLSCHLTLQHHSLLVSNSRIRMSSFPG